MAGAPLGNQNAARRTTEWKDALKRALERKNIGRAKKRAAIDAIADKVVDQALAGDQFAIREIGDRLDGKAAVILGGEGPEGAIVMIAKEESKL